MRINMALNLLNKSMFMRKHINKIFNIVLIVVVSIILGYALRMYHEGKIKEGYKSQAEKDLSTLEEEFYSALKKPRSFLIFNGMFKVYPMSNSERIFYYRKANDSRNDNLQITKNMEDNGNQQGDIVSDVPSLNDSRIDKPQIIKNMIDNENKQADIISDILPLNENEQIGIVSDAPSLNDLKQ
jgi:hypothetical protein